MTIGPMVPLGLSSQQGAAVPDSKASGAAKQFESLLIAQMLKSLHEDGSGWLGTGDDKAGQAATDFAEEQLASVIAKSGGFGLAKTIEPSLTPHQKLQD